MSRKIKSNSPGETLNLTTSSLGECLESVNTPFLKLKTCDNYDESNEDG